MKKWIAVTVFIAVSCAVSFILGLPANYFTIDNIQFQLNGSKSISEQSDQWLSYEINHLKSHLSDLYGRDLYAISKSNIAERFAQFNWIKSYRVFRAWPNSLNIEITTRDAAAIEVQNNSFAIILDNAKRLKNVPFNKLPSRPLVFLGDQNQNKLTQSELMTLLNDLPKDGGLSRSKLSDIQFNPQTGFKARLQKGGIEVLLGFAPFADKITRVNQVLRYLDHHKYGGRVIDASFGKKVLVRLRKAP